MRTSCCVESTAAAIGKGRQEARRRAGSGQPAQDANASKCEPEGSRAGVGCQSDGCGPRCGGFLTAGPQVGMFSGLSAVDWGIAPPDCRFRTYRFYLLGSFPCRISSPRRKTCGSRVRLQCAIVHSVRRCVRPSSGRSSPLLLPMIACLPFRCLIVRRARDSSIATPLLVRRASWRRPPTPRPRKRRDICGTTKGRTR